MTAPSHPSDPPIGTPDIRLPSTYYPWTNATSEDRAASVSACGTAWVAGRLLAGRELAEYVSGTAGSAPRDQRLEGLLGLCRQLNGSWAFVALWPDGEAMAAVDRLRSMPLFYGRLSDGRLALSSRAASLADCVDSGSLNEEAALEFLLSGYVMDSRTLREGIFQLQPGEVLHWANGTTRLHRYYRFLRTEVSNAGPGSLTQMLHATMDEVFARLVQQFDDQRIIVPLSGGLDSRLIAAMLKRHGHRDLVAFSYGRPGSQEAETSRAVAEALNIPWEFFPYEDGDWHPVVSAPEMRDFWHHAGQAAALPYLQEYLALQRLRRRDPGLQAVFFPGYVGDMIAGTWTPGPLVYRDLRSSPRPQLSKSEGPVDLRAVCDWLLFVRYNLWPAGRNENRVIQQRMRSFFEVVPFTGDHNSATAIDLFEFENRETRYIANGVRSFEFHGFGWWLPLCDGELMDFFLTVPTDLREDKGLYALWMRSHIFVGKMSRLAEIPPIGVGRYPWYGEPGTDLRMALQQRTQTVRTIYKSIEPRFLRRWRFGKALQGFNPPDMRFDEWFAADDAHARSVKLVELMGERDGLFSGLPPSLADRFQSRLDYPLCFVDPLAMLAAAYLADMCRSDEERHQSQPQ